MKQLSPHALVTLKKKEVDLDGDDGEEFDDDEKLDHSSHSKSRMLSNGDEVVRIIDENTPLYVLPSFLSVGLLIE